MQFWCTSSFHAGTRQPIVLDYEMDGIVRKECKVVTVSPSEPLGNRAENRGQYTRLHI